MVLTAPCLFGGRYDRLTAVLDQGGLRYLDAGAGLFLWIDLRRARTPHCTAHRTAPPDPPSPLAPPAPRPSRRPSPHRRPPPLAAH